MKFFKVTATAVFLYAQVHASPVNLVSRGKTGILLSFLELVGTFFPDNNVFAWDVEEHPQFCNVYMETNDGSNCKATVTCSDGEKEYNPNGATWNVCYVGGRQYFNDPRIGDFSITFTKRDGTEGEGLTDPILQVATIGNWAEIPVSELANEYGIARQCDDYDGVNCFKDGPWICHYVDYGIDTKRTKKWSCGIPRIGESVGDLDNNAPVNNRGYATGSCGVHVTQYQKPDPSRDQYALEVRIFDDNESQIGGTDGRAGPSASMASKLPYTLEIKTGGVDADPVRFAYAGFEWDSNSPNCNVGGYESGDRDMDCSFSCTE